MKVNTFGCVGNTIKLNSGKYFDIAEPRPADFTFYDIASALAKVCRFGGQCAQFYSVAEHSVHCSQVAMADCLTIDVQIALLMHDATEAFIGDIVKPLKNMLSEYRDIEQNVQDAISQKFGIDFDQHESAIKEIDHAMLIAERRTLFGSDNVTWNGENECRKLNVTFHRWLPLASEWRFTELAQQLGINTAE